MNKPKIILTGRCTCCGSTDVYFVENNKKIACKQCNNWAWTEEALQTNWINYPINISEMRNLTPEERESINKYIESISKPTGINIFDLYKEEERCRVCGGIKRFGICQDCGTDS